MSEIGPRLPFWAPFWGPCWAQFWAPFWAPFWAQFWSPFSTFLGSILDPVPWFRIWAAVRPQRGPFFIVAACSQAVQNRCRILRLKGLEFPSLGIRLRGVVWSWVGRHRAVLCALVCDEVSDSSDCHHTAARWCEGHSRRTRGEAFARARRLLGLRLASGDSSLRRRVCGRWC